MPTGPIYSDVIPEIFEEHASASENWSLEQGPGASATLRVPWDQRYVVAKDLLLNLRPWPYYTPMGSGATNQLCATRVRIDNAKGVQQDPIGSDEQTIVYEDALLMVTYESAYKYFVGQQPSGDPEDLSTTPILVSEEFIERVQYSKLDYRKYKWVSDQGSAADPDDGSTLSENEAPSRRLISGTLRRTLYRVPGEIPDEYFSLIGTSNEVAYTSPIFGLFDVETLIFKPGQAIPTVDFDGEKCFTYKLEYDYHPDGANRYWHASANKGNGQFDQIRVNDKDLFDAIVAEGGDGIIRQFEPTDQTIFLFGP